MSDLPCIEYRKLKEEWEKPLAEFFEVLTRSKDSYFFHPHPFNSEQAYKISHYKGNDIYMAITEGVKILGYGILRGWDEGYEIPSLGIAISPEIRGIKIGESFLYFLHANARKRGAKKIRMKVYLQNTVALNLYKKAGYVFEKFDEKQVIGFIDL